MQDVYIASDNMITSLGFTTAENLDRLIKGESGLQICADKNISPEPVPISLVDSNRLEKQFAEIADNESYTRYEKLHILSIRDALNQTNIDPTKKNTLFIFSTTKGNIDLLEKKEKKGFDRKRQYLWESARIISEFFGNSNQPFVISNACISGVVAINHAAGLIKSGKIENVVVSGADIMSEFVVSGFQSFKAISPQICKPFDANRDGISIGEGAGTVILTSNNNGLCAPFVCVTGGATSNDANHISGPSRTGDGLYSAISRSLEEAGVEASEIDYISAHGTATPFNDEMEAKALAWAGLEGIPVNSLKGFFGHTLGAAGILESIVTINCLKNNMLIKTYGYEQYGVSGNINVIDRFQEKELNKCLKTASGFGGCNVAAVFEKK